MAVYTIGRIQLLGARCRCSAYRRGGRTHRGDVAFGSLQKRTPQRVYRPLHGNVRLSHICMVLAPTQLGSLCLRELHLQIKLIELQGLLSQTQHEPRLKGPFPVKLYRSILTSLQTILDKLHSMRCVTSREEWFVICHFTLPWVLTQALFLGIRHVTLL